MGRSCKKWFREPHDRTRRTGNLFLIIVTKNVSVNRNVACDVFLLFLVAFSCGYSIINGENKKSRSVVSFSESSIFTCPGIFRFRDPFRIASRRGPMNNMSEVIGWTEEYMALVDSRFDYLLPVQRKILEKSRELIVNNAAAHLAELAPIDFISMLPQSERYFFSRIEPWWAKYV
jgi:hypothetical protein